jgi:outer membrane usher protein
VRVEGRLAGETDASGRLVVNSLSSYSGQRVTIDAEALPPDWEVGDVEQRVSTPLRGGAVVRFEAQVYRATAGRLLDPEGKPVGSATLVLPDGRRIATATGGEFVVEGDPPRGVATVLRPGQGPECRVRFDERAPVAGAPITRLGELRCTP